MHIAGLFWTLISCAVFKQHDLPTEGESPYGSDTGESPVGDETDSDSDTSDTESTDTGWWDTGTWDTGDEDTGTDICSQQLPYVDNESECYTQEIRCGQSILMSTEGGTSYYDMDLYRDWYTTGHNRSDYTGTERVFYFWHPGSSDSTLVEAEFRLESPCENMDLLYFRLPSSDAPACYGSGHNISGSDISDENSLTDEILEIEDSSPVLYIVIVESRDASKPGPFVLTADCGEQ
jgi:hypothetical protein